MSNNGKGRVIDHDVFMTGGLGAFDQPQSAVRAQDHIRDSAGVSAQPHRFNDGTVDGNRSDEDDSSIGAKSFRHLRAIAGNDFAGPYRSTFTVAIPDSQKPALLDCLTNVNCSYLSKPGLPPTLTHLKQHAQALTILIKNLTMSTKPGSIDSQHSSLPTSAKFNDGETFDWLNDLAQRYTGPEKPGYKRHHDMPLTSILNNLLPPQGHDELIDICPLHTPWRGLPDNAPSLPYAKHQALIQHANEVLELLDHEYSAKGGLLSILPSKDEVEDRKYAESTLLGQFILYMNRLVQRLHDLELLYANSMDALAGEAAVPLQALSRLGPDGRQGREMVFPQDRFVLVNAGDDIWQFLNTEFERKERTDEQVAKMYKDFGVTGEALWQQRGGKEYSRGITAIDVVTRYYRLRNDSLKTIFVIPAHAEHPGTKVTREMETKPTVVSVVKPMWPERQSQWEMKHRADLQAYKMLKVEHRRMESELENKTNSVKVLRYENDKQQVKVDQLQQLLAEKQALFDHPGPTHELKKKIDVLTGQLAESQRAQEDERSNFELGEQNLNEGIEALNREREEFYAMRKGWNDQHVLYRQTAHKDAQLAELAVRLGNTQGPEWQRLLQQTLALQRMLFSTASAMESNLLSLPEDTMAQAGDAVQQIVQGLVSAWQGPYSVEDPWAKVGVEGLRKNRKGERVQSGASREHGRSTTKKAGGKRLGQLARVDEEVEEEEDVGEIDDDAMSDLLEVEDYE